MIKTNYPLKNHNTFGIDAVAAQFAEIRHPDDLSKVLNGTDATKTLVLGGGSNLLLPDHFSGLVLYNNIQFIERREPFGNELHIEVGGGGNWHELVLWSLRQGYGGLENMALIPGTVGAAPIQNIGAYGRELKDIFVSLKAQELATGKRLNFSHEDCEFDYRHSFFKRPEQHNRYLITSVTLRLTTHDHERHTHYGAIQQQLEASGIQDPTPQDIAGAVIEIRRSKLPDWRQLGNAGSFFKNPVLPQQQFTAIKQQHPDIPSYPADGDMVKVPAAWLIDQSGWKGQRDGAVGCYEKQALVLVNHGGATAKEVVAFSGRIVADVEAKFGVTLEREVTVVRGYVG